MNSTESPRTVWRWFNGSAYKDKRLLSVFTFFTWRNRSSLFKQLVLLHVTESPWTTSPRWLALIKSNFRTVLGSMNSVNRSRERLHYQASLSATATGPRSSEPKVVWRTRSTAPLERLASRSLLHRQLQIQGYTPFWNSAKFVCVAAPL